MFKKQFSKWHLNIYENMVLYLYYSEWYVSIGDEHNQICWLFKLLSNQWNNCCNILDQCVTMASIREMQNTV